MEVFVRTDDDRLAALVKANAIRAARAQLKRSIRAGDVDVATVIASPPEYAGRMKTADALTAVRGVGANKVRRVFLRCGISESKTLAGLTSRQRVALVNEMGGRRRG